MDGNIMNPKAGPNAPGTARRIDAFTIPEAAWPSEEVVTEILLSLVTNRANAEPARVNPSTEPKTDYFRVMIDVATNAWRARIEIIDPRTGKVREDLQAVDRHIEAIFQSLAEFGIEVYHHTGQPYEEGQSLHVVESVPTPGLDQNVITETVLPSIFWNDRLIQSGEVKIATPAPSSAANPST